MSATTTFRRPPMARAHEGDTIVDLTIPEAWDRYRATGDLEARNKLIEHFMRFVKAVAGDMMKGMPGHIDRDDLVSYGTFGLLAAMAKYDPATGSKFESFAYARVRGSMVDGIRDNDWAPRSVRSGARKFLTAAETLTSTLGRTPTHAEIEDAMGARSGAVHTLRGAMHLTHVQSTESVLASTQPGASSRALTMADTLSDPNAVDPQAAVDGEARDHILAITVRALTEQQRRIVSLYYYEGLNFREIGERLGVTESRICQVHKVLTRKLRRELIAEGIDSAAA